MSATRKLCALQLVANALLFWLGYEWLGVAESTRARLAMSALDALAILALVCWLHGATFAYFGGEPKINPAFRTALRHLAALVLAAIAVIALYGLIGWAASGAGQPAFQLASWMTLHLRKPIKPATVLRIFQVIFWIVRWIVLPVALLPMASAIAARGWRGFGVFGWRSGWRYWLGVPLLLLAGLQAPLMLLGWVPAVGGFGLQMTSFALRIGVGYLLFVAAAVGLAYWTGRQGRIKVVAPSSAVLS